MAVVEEKKCAICGEVKSMKKEYTICPECWDHGERLRCPHRIKGCMWTPGCDLDRGPTCSDCYSREQEERAKASGKQVGGSHYKDMPIQPAEFCQRNRLTYCESNAIKYLCRHRGKGGREDLEKAKHYIDLILEWEYGG